VSIHEQQRVDLKIVNWTAEEGVGVVIDRQGIRYNVSIKDMAPEFRRADMPIRAGEIVSGVVVDFDRVRGIQSDQRIEFDTVGPAPTEEGWNPHRGTPQKFGTPDTGRFSHPKQ
jgi:hypothetical protein